MFDRCSPERPPGIGVWLDAAGIETTLSGGLESTRLFDAIYFKARPRLAAGATIEMSSVRSEGGSELRAVMTTQARNNVVVTGDGPSTMLFAHGFGCDQNTWRRLAPLYASRYRTVVFDLVGSGNSDESAFSPEKYATLQGHANDLAEIVAEYGRGPAILVGHSVAAMVGVLADNKRPGLFAAHAMVGPSPCYINDESYKGGFSRADIDSLLTTMEGNYLGWSSAMAPAIMGSSEQPELGVELTNSFCRTNPEIAKHFARVTFLSDHRADLPKLQTPALIIQCDDDMIAPVEVGEYMQAHLPNATLRVIDNVGHCPHLSQPAACAAAIDEFLAAHGL